MKIHFVYAGHPDNNSNASPYTITRELYRYMRARVDVAYYDWCTLGCPWVDKNDIILGHPNYDPNTITQRFFATANCRAKCLIFPLHHGIPEHNLPFDQLALQADRIFSIMGPYWYDTLESSPFAHWKPKITRVDMAVDASKFPFARESFAPPGRRNLIYIGNARPEKHIELLYEIMRRLPDIHLTWYGGGYEPMHHLPNVTIIGWTDFTPAIAKTMVKAGDFFINCSQSDANPTTLLEAMCWGLIPVCTKQSGYHNDPLFTNIPQNADDAAAVIRGLQEIPGETLLERARAARAEVERKYCWERFCETIWAELSKYIANPPRPGGIQRCRISRSGTPPSR